MKSRTGEEERDGCEVLLGVVNKRKSAEIKRRRKEKEEGKKKRKRERRKGGAESRLGRFEIEDVM